MRQLHGRRDHANRYLSERDGEPHFDHHRADIAGDGGCAGHGQLLERGDLVGEPVEHGIDYERGRVHAGGDRDGDHHSNVR